MGYGFRCALVSVRDPGTALTGLVRVQFDGTLTISQLMPIKWPGKLFNISNESQNVWHIIGVARADRTRGPRDIFDDVHRAPIISFPRLSRAFRPAWASG